jgi:2-dehydro-3-deoxygluconokinase
MTELVTFGETALGLSPPASERLETATDVRMRADGTESNVAVAATRLGTDSVWLSKLPDTQLGRRVLSELHAHDLDTEVAWADPESGRQGLTFFESGAEPRDPVRIQDREGSVAGTAEPGELAMDLVQEAGAVFVGGSTPALSATAHETTESILRAAAGTCVMDLDFRPGLWSAGTARERLRQMFDAVEVLVTSEDDAQAVFESSDSGRDLLHGVAAEGEFEQVVVTRGEYGAVAMVDNVVHERDAVVTEAVDRAGQHEAFVGAYLSQYLADEPTERALDVGVAAAALTRTLAGSMTRVSRSEVEGVVESMGNDRDR